MKISILFPDHSLKFNKLSDETFHDLGMDSIVKQLTPTESEQTYIRNVMSMLTPEAGHAAYRGDVFDDIYRNPGMRKELMKLLDRVNFLRDYGSYKHDHDHDPGVWDLMHRLDEINDYISCIEAVYSCLKGADISSKGLISLRDYVEKLYTDNGFGELKEDIKNLRADTGNLKSVTVGINLNERFEACGIGIISINNKPFTKSSLVGRFMDKVVGKDQLHDGTDWDGDYRFDEFTAKNPLASGRLPVIPPLSPLALMTMKSISEADNQARSITNYMDEITDRLAPQATMKGVSLVVHALDPCEVECDAQLIESAISNLVVNAIRHSGSDYVWISVSREDGRACITVEDHGVGIPEEHREKVFDRFHRVDGSRSAETGGAGLGLAIVRRIALLHGGDVTLEPATPSGCRFILTLPA
ncbi:MAG: HAMP domain-containing histidine kinase [Kiritimatiellae bacterium]|nr:HAMP domain-containing histidine kinase [Kiritimatiellia bacterium]